MATPVGAHPSADTLRAFGQGKLDDFAAQGVIDHLARCAACARAVAAQSGDDFLVRLREARQSGTTPVPVKAAGRRAAEPAPLPAKLTPPLANLPPELAANEQYEILRELGRGGMGVVYLARNRLLQRLEVLKVVNQDLLTRAGGKERFLREIQSAAKLNHPNVVTAYNAMQIGGLLFFAMEYVEGEDLAQVVKTRGLLPVVNACYYVQQAAQGLQHAWDKQMVHRDIKPQNLILARVGKRHVVKILDFGLAKIVREKGADPGLTGAGKMLGTPDYIAPEQTMDAAHADIRADIYSLGCTFYYLLTGGPPFKGNTLYAILQAHHTETATPANVLRPEVPAAVAGVVARMMAKTPAERYQKPAEVAHALAPIVKAGAKALMSGPILKSTPVGRGPEKKPGVGNETMVAAAFKRDTPAERPGIIVRTRETVLRPAFTPGRGKTWLVAGGAAIGMLCLAILIGLWAGGVFRARTGDDVPPATQANEPKADASVAREKSSRALLEKKGNVEPVEKKGSVPRPSQKVVQVQPVDNQGFVPLFNKKDLDGWKKFPEQPGGWRVENGILIGSGPVLSSLYTERGDYRDFDLRFEARINQEGSCGVCFRAPFGPHPLGYETRINCRGNEWRTGSLFRDGKIVVNLSESPIQPAQWFKMDIRATRGGPRDRFMIKVNGFAAVDFTDTVLLSPRGYIALRPLEPQTVVEFKNIDIREFGPGRKVAVSPEPKRGPGLAHYNLPGFGNRVDPDGDCHFRLFESQLHIQVPGRRHDLAIEVGRANAPRVLREIEGDFQAEVVVSGNLPTDPRNLFKGRMAFHAAGLVIWQDDRNYIRLERAHAYADKWVCYPNWEARTNGQYFRQGSLREGVLQEDKPVSLRVVRTGNVFTGFYGQDGLWKELPPINVDFAGKLQVGVCAIQNTPSPFEAVFTDLKVLPNK